jgi:hypothetical protein
MDYLPPITPEEYAIAKKNGIPKGYVDKRIEGGWSKERAITEKVKRTGKRRKYPLEIMLLAESNGIDYRTFYYRVNKEKDPFTLEEAATIPVGMGQRYRKHPRKWLELAEKNGIPYDVFNERREAGVPYEVAATRKVHHRLALPRKFE